MGILGGERERLNLWPRRRGCLREGTRVVFMVSEDALYSCRDVRRGEVGAGAAGRIGGVGDGRRVL